MNEQQQEALAKGLRALADRTREQRASVAVEQAILAQMAGAAAGSRQAGSRFIALAAGLLLAVTTALWIASGDRPDGPIAIHPSGFLPVPQASALPEIESASIVQVSLPVAALPVYGIAIMPEAVTDSVQAELLVAQDGQARAIRLINNSTNSRSER